MKKQQQLGMNPSTASHRLVKDILFSLIKDTPCFHCGEPLTRETFSIEHKAPWLNSDDPVGRFFDLDNISYSHLLCNTRAGGRDSKLSEQKRSERNKEYYKKYRAKMTKEERKEKRRQQYLRTGK